MWSPNVLFLQLLISLLISNKCQVLFCHYLKPKTCISFPSLKLKGFSSNAGTLEHLALTCLTEQYNLVLWVDCMLHTKSQVSQITKEGDYQLSHLCFSIRLKYLLGKMDKIRTISSNFCSSFHKVEKIKLSTVYLKKRQERQEKRVERLLYGSRVSACD